MAQLRGAGHVRARARVCSDGAVVSGDVPTGRRTRLELRCRIAARRCLWGRGHLCAGSQVRRLRVPRRPVRLRAFAAADHRQHEERYDWDCEHAPWPRRTPDPPYPSKSPDPSPRHRRDEAHRRVVPLRTLSLRRLDRVVQRRRVLAPERICRGGQARPGVALRRARSGSGTDGNEFLRRTQPIPREAYDVLLARSQPASVFGSPIARFHGVCRPFFVRVPVRLRGEVQYKPELDPVCLN